MWPVRDGSTAVELQVLVADDQNRQRTSLGLNSGQSGSRNKLAIRQACKRVAGRLAQAIVAALGTPGLQNRGIVIKANRLFRM
jgi:hypothetical protein